MKARAATSKTPKPITATLTGSNAGSLNMANLDEPSPVPDPLKHTKTLLLKYGES
jgi:hypothetical protein